MATWNLDAVVCYPVSVCACVYTSVQGLLPQSLLSTPVILLWTTVSEDCRRWLKAPRGKLWFWILDYINKINLTWLIQVIWMRENTKLYLSPTLSCTSPEPSWCSRSKDIHNSQSYYENWTEGLRGRAELWASETDQREEVFLCNQQSHDLMFLIAWSI